MISGHVAATSAGADHVAQRRVVLLQDRPSHVPFSNILQAGDLLLLLTPVVLPIDSDTGRDPFEPLGTALAKYHPWVRHVPYTAEGGITSTHVGFIKRARIVVFVISGPPSPNQLSQVDLSSIVQEIGERRPHVVVTLCDVQDLEPEAASFPTILQLSGYSTRELEGGADILFLGRPTQPSPPAGTPIHQELAIPHIWNVTGWDQTKDTPAVYELWHQCMPSQFKIHQVSLIKVLQRDGYAKHFVVREPGTNQMLGFCATYITYLDGQGETLVGSIAALFVRASHRRQGIGSMLHNEAMRGFKKTRGVNRLQLGSTFPRLFYGLPVDHPAEDWFKRRGWRMDCTAPGTGQEAIDWLLAFTEWPLGGFESVGLTFRRCGFADFDRVLEIVEQESRREGHMGWYDQYAKLADSISMDDIMVGSRGDEIVAMAITYISHSDNPSADDLPWAGSISEDTGGVTCICITGTLSMLFFRSLNQSSH